MEDPRISARVKAAIDKQFAVGSDIYIPAWREKQRRERAGHHGINAYNCPKCGLNTMTIDVDPGVTPMFLGCRRTPGCDGLAVSAGYPDEEPPAKLLEHLDWEWTLQPPDVYEATPEEERFVADGGLYLVPRSDRPSAYRDGYWGGIMPPAREGASQSQAILDESTPIFDKLVGELGVELEPWQRQMAAYMLDGVPAKAIETDDLPPGVGAVIGDFDAAFDKGPRNRAERRAAAKAARLGAAKKADRRISALMATMTPREIAAANRLADQQLGERRGR